MSAVVELLITGGGLPLSVVVARSGFARLHALDPVIYALHFPADLDNEAVERFLVALTGLLPPWWKGWLTRPVVAFELVATADRIAHHLVVPIAVQHYLESALQAHLPGTRYERLDSHETRDCLWAVEYRATSAARPLRVDAAAVGAGLLSAAGGLHHGEQLVLQWLVTPDGPVSPARRPQPRAAHGVLPEQLPDSEAVTALRTKQRAPLLLATGRIGAVASNVTRARALVRRLEGPLHATRAPGVHLTRRFLPGRLVALRVHRRSEPVTRFPIVINTEEAAAVLGWPIGNPAVPGLRLGASRLLPVAQALPGRGTVLGMATFPGQADRQVALGLEARYRHLAVTGPTGTGKTTLLVQIAVQDLEAGHGLVAIDPKGEMVTRILERLPANRLEDTMVLDAGGHGPVIGYNPLRSTSPDLAVEQILGVMKRIWLANWGPRTDALLRAALATLAKVPGMTICEIEPLLIDRSFRRNLMNGITDPFGVEAAWRQYEAWSDAEQVAAAAPLLTKVQALTTRPRIRGILGQADGAVDFSRLIRERQVLLVNLAAGRVGSDAAYLLGALLFAGFWDSVSARSDEGNHPPVMALLDEFQHVVQLPTPIETVLAEARSYRLGLTLAHQHLGQLTPELKHAVLANARSRVVFQAAQEDAAVLARELGGRLTAADLMGLPAYEAVVKAYAEGQVQAPATIRTFDLPPKRQHAGIVRTASQARWGSRLSSVEAAMVERRHGASNSAAPVGRRRRSS